MVRETLALHALSCLPGRRFLIRSEAPAIDADTVVCQARVYVVRYENVDVNGIEDAVHIENIADYGQAGLKSGNKALKGR